VVGLRILQVHMMGDCISRRSVRSLSPPGANSTAQKSIGLLTAKPGVFNTCV
jgi:hypothetical protein